MEFVFHYSKPLKNDLEIQIGHSLIPITSFSKTGLLSYAVHSNIPSDPQKIILEDASKKTGCCGIKAKEIPCQIFINQPNFVNKSELNTLPDTIILKNQSLELYKAYREYFAHKSIYEKNINSDLPSDPVFWTF